MIGIPLFFVFRTTFLPTKQMYFGIHKSTDMAFGTSQSRDPFVGAGTKIKDLIARGARRHHFDVHTLFIGTQADAQRYYDRIVFDYDHPLCLNTKEGAPAGVPKTEEHKAAISEALTTAMEDNTNAVGTIHPPRAVHGGKIKWFNDGAGNQLMLETVDGDKPVDAVYSSWVKGKLPLNSKKATVSSDDLAK
jgi:hypothetical protein